jgi:Ubiquitin carboxyl-terminal hydrolase
MPVFISREQQCNTDLQLKERDHKTLSKKLKSTFPVTKKENRKVKHHNSEENLFRIRKKFFFKCFSPEKPTLSKKVLKENNINSGKTRKIKHLTENIASREFDKIKSEARSNKGDVALKQQHNQKRKIVLEEKQENRKAQKLLKTLAKVQSCENMYEYRHQLTSVSKNEGDSNYLPKNDVNENDINVFYQQQCLGGSNNSIATLCNIGNSCYLNSVIYTLRFAPHFLHKLHHLVDDMRHVYQKIGQHKLKSSSLGRNVSGLQNNNGRSWSSKDLVSLNGVNSNGIDPLLKTNRQIATEKLHELYQSLHRNESIDTVESFHAGTFLQAIQDVSSIFEGNQQQDAHELLMCILDSLRETCSTLIKTIKENPEIMNQSLQTADSSDMTSPPQSNVHSAQSLKSIFSRKIRRKDTLKNNGGMSSPIKENVADSVVEEEPSVETSTNKLDGEVPIVDNNDKINEAIKRLGLDFFCKDFEGITLFTTKCLTCETVTEQKETMVDIAIPISHDSLTQPIDPQLFFQVIKYL